METNPNKMDTETAEFNPTEWLEKFIIISQEEFISSESGVPGRYESKIYDGDDIGTDEDSADEDDDDDEKIVKFVPSKTTEAQCDLLMIRMGPLFASQPRLEKICKKLKNDFLQTCFKSYSFVGNENDSANELHEKTCDAKYVISLCGSNLTSLNLSNYPTSQIMPIINANCPNLTQLIFAFNEVMSQDFENVFSNMSHLEILTIHWQCENSVIPMTLAKSLEQIIETLHTLRLISKADAICSLQSLASVFPRLIALKSLYINGFKLRQPILQSIGEMENLTELHIKSLWPKSHPWFNSRINMYPIGNLTNLEKLVIDSNFGVRDEFLINLCNNARNLKFLRIDGRYITDTGLRAIRNLEQLENFDIGMVVHNTAQNEFITDESVQCSFNTKVHTLDLSNCIKITDKSFIKLLESLPNLQFLYLCNTKVTFEAVKKIIKSLQHRIMIDITSRTDKIIRADD